MNNVFSAKSQFITCSYGKFEPVAYSGTTTTGEIIRNVVAEVYLAINIIREQKAKVKMKCLELQA